MSNRHRLTLNFDPAIVLVRTANTSANARHSNSDPSPSPKRSKAGALPYPDTEHRARFVSCSLVDDIRLWAFYSSSTYRRPRFCGITPCRLCIPNRLRIRPAPPEDDDTTLIGDGSVQLTDVRLFPPVFFIQQPLLFEQRGLRNPRGLNTSYSCAQIHAVLCSRSHCFGCMRYDLDGIEWFASRLLFYPLGVLRNYYVPPIAGLKITDSTTRSFISSTTLVYTAQ